MPNKRYKVMAIRFLEMMIVLYWLGKSCEPPRIRVISGKSATELSN